MVVTWQGEQVYKVLTAQIKHMNCSTALGMLEVLATLQACDVCPCACLTAMARCAKATKESSMVYHAWQGCMNSSSVKQLGGCSSQGRRAACLEARHLGDG